MSELVKEITVEAPFVIVLDARGEEEGCEASVYWIAHGIYAMVVVDSIDRLMNIMIDSILHVPNIKVVRTNSRLLKERVEQLLSQT